MHDKPEMLYVGAGRSIVALDRLTGRPLWRRKLPRHFGDLVTILVQGDELYVGRGGYVYCLDRWSGDVLWERGVDLTAGPVLMAVDGHASAHEVVGAYSSAEYIGSNGAD